MWGAKHRQRVKAKGVALGKSWEVQHRGEVGGRGGVHGGAQRTPFDGLARAIRNALDPSRASGKVTRLADMTPKKRAEMERLYPPPGKSK